MLQAARFQRIWKQLTDRTDGLGTFAELIAAYSEPQRAYHNTDHIADCLGQFDASRALAHRPDELELALWFHDAIYDPHAHDNEARSAAWAVEALTSANVGAAAIARIEALILFTRHDREPLGRDGELLVDIDLSILGRDPDMFATYNRNIREEYSWVPEDRYRAARAEVLECFLNRPAIYRTDFFRSRFEESARQNLQQCIARLRQGS